MTTFEDLICEAEKNSIIVKEKSFKSNAKGFCKGNVIGISKNLSNSEKVCILAEELGHFYKTTGDILDQSYTTNLKQERLARNWACKRLLHIDDIVAACKNECSNIYEICRYLNITENFLRESLEYFKTKLGVKYSTKTYTIVFTDSGFTFIEND